MKNWQTYYEELTAYLKENGVSPKSKHPLYQWSYQQKYKYQNGQLSPEQVKLLDQIRFLDSFSAKRKSWEKRYDELVLFVETYGRIPNHNDNKELSNWLNQQKFRHKNKDLKEEYVKLLDAIDELENTNTNNWLDMYSKLKKFVETHFRYPFRSMDDEQKLFAWTQSQRRKAEANPNATYRPLKPWQLQKLEAIYFPFNNSERYDKLWMLNYQGMKKHLEKHALKKLDSMSADIHPLMKWLRKQKNDYRLGHVLTDKQVRLLKELGQEIIEYVRIDM